MAVNFHNPVSVTELNRFISEELQPTEAFNQEMNQIVDRICDFLRTHMKPHRIVKLCMNFFKTNMAETFSKLTSQEIDKIKSEATPQHIINIPQNGVFRYSKGGSLGKGTAIKGKCDIDLVLALNEVQDAADLKRKLPGIQTEIVDALRKNSRLHITSLSTTQFSVKFTVQGGRGNIDIDLLPTFHFNDLKNLYRNMKADRRDHVPFYSAALVGQQVQFVSKYSANVKNLIRLVKYWKKRKVPARPGQRIPTSYVMELITINLCERNTRWGGRFDTLKAFKDVMEALKDYRSLNVAWQDNYSQNDIPREIQKERPLVMDPANPMNNVCSRFQWEEIGRAAREVLASPMLREV